MADDGGRSDRGDGDDGWRFGIDEVGSDAADGDGEGSNVLGSTDAALEDPEPGSPTAENAFFVLLGAATMIGIIALLVV